ncbi:MAG: Histone-like Protein p6 [Bacteriophage sp.]|nr:MAG: Histone-like Protein p6 [Bacteriophage sp.]
MSRCNSDSLVSLIAISASNKINKHKKRNGDKKTMRKEKMITRTIVTTNAEIMTFNLDTNEVITLNESYIGDLSDKDIEKQFTIDYSNSAKFLKLVNAEKSSKLYGITEKDFLENAVELDENRKEVK